MHLAGVTDASESGFDRVAARLVAEGPDAAVILSVESEGPPGWTLHAEPRLRVRAGPVTWLLRGAGDEARVLEEAALLEGLSVRRGGEALDDPSLAAWVAALGARGWGGPTMVVRGRGDEAALGRAIAVGADVMRARWGLLTAGPGRFHLVSPGTVGAGGPPPWLPALARHAISSRLAGRRFRTTGVPAMPARGVVVTLRDRAGRVRGRAGSALPFHATLGEEVAHQALAAALADLRFAPLAAAELPDVRIEVGLVDPPRPVDRLVEVDPELDGLIVHAGTRRGVVFPDGRRTVEDALLEALDAAHIEPSEAWDIMRFRVHAIGERT